MMARAVARAVLRWVGVCACALWAWGPAGLQAADLERGEYLFQLSGCYECHTDADSEALAGGRALQTPYGTFYTPNITPDRETGIGTWTLTDFRRALRDGRSPRGEHYYPVFPYISYSQMTDRDVEDLWAYLQTRPAVSSSNRSHRLSPPFYWRPLLAAWKLLYFRPGPFEADPNRDPLWNRGAYIVRGLAHCGECHTPRNLAGGPRREVELAGTLKGPEGDAVPNITPDRDTGVGSWSDSDLHALLELGMMPDGDFVATAMADVVDSTTSFLTKRDRQAVISYLRSLPPVQHRIYVPNRNSDD